jgi:hypothetical protein
MGTSTFFHQTHTLLLDIHYVLIHITNPKDVPNFRISYLGMKTLSCGLTLANKQTNKQTNKHTGMPRIQNSRSSCERYDAAGGWGKGKMGV